VLLETSIRHPTAHGFHSELHHRTAAHEFHTSTPWAHKNDRLRPPYPTTDYFYFYFYDFLKIYDLHKVLQKYSLENKTLLFCVKIIFMFKFAATLLYQNM
jgi:hypothetical protein